ncbi:hypothetical protein ITP53_14940 [Nonomuraea sp. K274]|uniref:Uncharacterized protein n=1 Tax=Nonomuraea cypriaca TaxID=1187855 RepID=A0A931EWS3_9ACTN|nr:hypothetical protein [Nonomuraea cypriaca]MBF8187009.1 hypothetical protein [Nonomuraea cypriaca]
MIVQSTGATGLVGTGEVGEPFPEETSQQLDHDPAGRPIALVDNVPAGGDDDQAAGSRRPTAR